MSSRPAFSSGSSGVSVRHAMPEKAVQPESVLREKIQELEFAHEIPVLYNFSFPLDNKHTYSPKYTLALQIRGKPSAENEGGARYLILDNCVFSMQKSRAELLWHAHKLASFCQIYSDDFHIVLTGPVPKQELFRQVRSRTDFSLSGLADAAHFTYLQIPKDSTPEGRRKSAKAIDFYLKDLLKRSDQDVVIRPARRKAELMDILYKYLDDPRFRNEPYVASEDDIARARSAFDDHLELRQFLDIDAVIARLNLVEQDGRKLLRDRDHVWERQDVKRQSGWTDPLEKQTLPRSWHDFKTDVFGIYRGKLGRALTKEESYVLNGRVLEILMQVNARRAAPEPRKEVRQQTLLDPGFVFEIGNVIKRGRPTFNTEDIISCDYSDYGVAASPVIANALRA